MKKKSWILRPVAWLSTILMMLALQFVAEKLCLYAERLIIWLNTLSTAVIVILVVACGSVALSIFSTTVMLLPAYLVIISDAIYPSNHAFRYYFVGIYEIIGCAILIIAGLLGYVTGGSMFWFYLRYAWLIVASIVMMCHGRSASINRHGAA